MKWLFRTFFKTLRLVLGPVLLLRERLNAPEGLVRAPEAQQEVDRQCRDLALYQFKTCPFCIKVRQEMRRLSLNIEQRDAQHDAGNRAALLQGGGKAGVPCLWIRDEQGNERWMYESGDIMAYLRERFAA
ncbi:MAG: glutaredoxin domain-containing protein [Pseudomonadota bacterium]|nr:glutaredoxin domain-containing protein [Pseudomonadota bacterium]